MYDIINGHITEEDFFNGEDVRNYLENLNRVQLPARPRTDFLEGIEAGQLPAGARANIDRQMSAFNSRAQALVGPAGRAQTYIDGRRDLKGSMYERRISENYETLVSAGIDRLPDGYTPADINETILDMASPFRTSAHQRLGDAMQRENLLAKNNVMMPNEFVDNSVLSFVNSHRDWPRARLSFAVNQLLFFQTQIHELGHCLAS